MLSRLKQQPPAPNAAPSAPQQWAPQSGHPDAQQYPQAQQPAQPPPHAAQGQYPVITASQAVGMALSGMQHHHYQQEANQWNQRPPADPYKPQGGSDAIDPRTGRPYTERDGVTMTAKAAEAADKFRKQNQSKTVRDLLRERAAQAKKAVQGTVQAAVDARHKAETVVIGPRPSKASHDSVAAWVSYCACFACFLIPILGFFLVMLWQASKQGYSYYQPRTLSYPQRWQQTNCTVIDSDVQLQWFNPLDSQEFHATYRSVFTVNYNTILSYQVPGVPDLNLTNWYYVKGYRYAAALDSGGFVGYTHWDDSRLQGTGWACPILPGIPASISYQDAIRNGFIQNTSNAIGLPSPLGTRRALVADPGYEARLVQEEQRIIRGGFSRPPEAAAAAAAGAGAVAGGEGGRAPAQAAGGAPGAAPEEEEKAEAAGGRRLQATSYSRSYSRSSYAPSYAVRQTTRSRTPAPSYKYNCPDSRQQAQFNWNVWNVQKYQGSVPCWYPIDPAFPMGTPVILSTDPSPTDYTCSVACRVVWTFFVISIIMLIAWGLCLCQFVWAELNIGGIPSAAPAPAAAAQGGWNQGDYYNNQGQYPGQHPGYPGYGQQGQQGYYGAAPAGGDPSQQQQGYGPAMDVHAAGGAQAPAQEQVGAAPGGAGYGLQAEAASASGAQQQQQPDYWRQNDQYASYGGAGAQQQQQQQEDYYGGGNAAGGYGYGGYYGQQQQQPQEAAPQQWGGSVNNNPLAYR